METHFNLEIGQAKRTLKVIIFLITVKFFENQFSHRASDGPDDINSIEYHSLVSKEFLVVERNDPRLNYFAAGETKSFTSSFKSH